MPNGEQAGEFCTAALQRDLLISSRALSKVRRFRHRLGKGSRKGRIDFVRRRQRGIMETRLAGKVATITGGSRGLGAATAKLFSSEGAQIMLAEVNAPDPSLVDSLDGGAHFMRHDVSDAAGWCDLL
jgi:short chain dehydrogenase